MSGIAPESSLVVHLLWRARNQNILYFSLSMNLVVRERERMEERERMRERKGC